MSLSTDLVYNIYPVLVYTNQVFTRHISPKFFETWNIPSAIDMNNLMFFNSETRKLSKSNFSL